MKHPEAFYEFAKDFDMDKYGPTPAHYFIKMLDDKGMLSMNLT